MIKYQPCNGTHRTDVGKKATFLRKGLEPNAKLQTQRHIKVPIHYRGKLKELLDELENHKIITQIGSTPSDEPIYATIFFNPRIIIPRRDTFKVVLYTRHLNPVTDQSFESWPIEPLAPQLARANKKFKSAIDLMYAYAQAPLDEESFCLTSFSSGGKLKLFYWKFLRFQKTNNFFTKQMYSFFQKLIDQCFAVDYINDILLLAHTKTHMSDLIEQLHHICSSKNLKTAPENSLYILITVKIPGHETVISTTKLISCKDDDIHNLKTITSKTELMRFIDSMTFYCNFINEVHISLKPFYILLHEDMSFE